MKKWYLLFMCFSILFTSCLSELDKYYEVPDWLKGDSWKVMESKGNLKLFMSAIERSSFKDLVQGKGIITVMAPTDSAFQAYLQKHNYASVNDIPQSVLDQMVGFHVLQYSYNKEFLENYKPEGAASQNSLAGMYYKFRTYSRDSITVETDDILHKKYKVIHLDRLLPIFSDKLFTSNMIDAKSNYEFLFPGSSWTGTDGFNVSGASVLEYSKASDNGFVYVINKVLDPLPTIYQSLKNDADYSTFTTMYERFKGYAYDDVATNNYGKGDSLFVKNYSFVLPTISSEWPSTSYSALSTTYYAYNVFAPNNNAMQKFFTDYWSPYYAKLSDVKFEPLLAVLQNHVYSGSTLLFPQQIEAGTIKSPYGTPITFNRALATKREVCVNGSVYGLSDVLAPPMFNKVTGPMYRDPKYTMILDMMINGSLVSTLISNSVPFKVFYPSDSLLIKYTTVEGKRLYYADEFAAKYGNQYVKIDADGGPTPMSSSMKRSLAGSHIATEAITKRGDETIYRTLTSFNYLYTKGNKVYSSALYNQAVTETNNNKPEDKAPTFSLIDGNWGNGDAYALSENESSSALVAESNQFKYFAPDGPATPKDLNIFVKMAGLAGMQQTTPIYDFLMGERYIVLIPPSDQLVSYLVSNGMITKVDENTFTVIDKTKLTAYMKAYFINVNSSKLLDYPFPGARIEGSIVTFAKKADGTPVTLTISDKSSYISITDPKGTAIKVTNFFPRIYADGAVYLIDQPLIVE